MKPTLQRCLLLLCLLGLAACAGISRNPLPGDIHAKATVLGRDDLRYWGDNSRQENQGYSLYKQTREQFKARYAGVSGGEHHYLSVSGGGANGAYGAGAPWMVPVGAAMFTASDIAVVRDRFISKGFVNRAWGLPLYYAAQLVIAWSIAAVS